MALFSFSKKPEIPTTQIEQRSHRPIGISDHQTTSVSGEKLKLAVSDFVKANSGKTFTIDGEKDKEESIICTNQGESCLEAKVQSIQLFKIMQELDYICVLPQDPKNTFLECRK